MKKREQIILSLEKEEMFTVDLVMKRLDLESKEDAVIQIIKMYKELTFIN